MYSSYYIKNRNPVFPYMLLFGFFLCFGLIITIGYKSISNNDDSITNKDNHLIKITNLSSNGAAVVWETKNIQKTELNLFNKSKLLGLYLDDRDTQNQTGKRKYHYVTLKNLNPSTEYKISIKDGAVFKSISFKTRFKPNKIDKPIYTYGSIKEENSGQTIVLLFFDNYYPISTLSSINGEWILSNHLIIPEDIKTKSISEGNIGKLIYYFETKKPEVITLSYKQFNDEYSLAVSDRKNGKVAGLSTDQKGEIDSTINNNQKSISDKEDLLILIPENNALLDGSKPLFKGIAEPGQKLKFKIQPGSGNVYDTYANSDGIWTYVPYFGLENGAYEFTVTAYKNDNPVTKFRKFTILKSGEAVLGEATGEAKLSITPTPTQFAAPTNNPTPTIKIQPTNTPVVQPTQITPTSIQEPVSGLDIRLFGIISGFLIISGSLIFIFL